MAQRRQFRRAAAASTTPGGRPRKHRPFVPHRPFAGEPAIDSVSPDNLLLGSEQEQQELKDMFLREIRSLANDQQDGEPENEGGNVSELNAYVAPTSGRTGAAFDPALADDGRQPKEVNRFRQFLRRFSCFT